MRERLYCQVVFPGSFGQILGQEGSLSGDVRAESRKADFLEKLALGSAVC